MFGCLIERRAQCGAGGLLGLNYWEVWAVKSRETFYDSWNMQTLCLLTLPDTFSIQRTSWMIFKSKKILGNSIQIYETMNECGGC